VASHDAALLRDPRFLRRPMHRHRLALVACLVGAVAPIIQASPALAAGPVKITKIHYGQNGTNLNTEYIVFKNTTSSAVQLKGWKVISAPSSDNQTISSAPIVPRI